MIDHHENELDDLKILFRKVHFYWLKENLKQLIVDSAHIASGNLIGFAIEPFFIKVYF